MTNTIKIYARIVSFVLSLQTFSETIFHPSKLQNSQATGSFWADGDYGSVDTKEYNLEKLQFHFRSVGVTGVSQQNFKIDSLGYENWKDAGYKSSFLPRACDLLFYHFFFLKLVLPGGKQIIWK